MWKRDGMAEKQKKVSMTMDQKNQHQTPTKKKPEKSIEKPEQWEKEYGGPEGPEPTRYNDWTIRGRCSDF